MLFNWIFATGLGYVAWHYVLRHLSSALASQALMLIPIEAAALGAAFRDDPITPSAMIAAALIICGVSLTLWRDVLRPGAGRPHAQVPRRHSKIVARRIAPTTQHIDTSTSQESAGDCRERSGDDPGRAE